MTLHGLPCRGVRCHPGTSLDPTLEWIVTNGLGGYASGPVRGGLTRRFHGLLIAALSPPHGRTMCLNLLRVAVVDEGHETWVEHETIDALDTGVAVPTAFDLIGGLPVWRFETPRWTLERRVVMPHEHNTTHVLFTLLCAHGPVSLHVRPMFQIRHHEGPLGDPPPPVRATEIEPGLVALSIEHRSLSLHWKSAAADTAPGRFTHDPLMSTAEYAIEHARGYDHRGHLVSPGLITLGLSAGEHAAFSVSAGPVDALRACEPRDDLSLEYRRRAVLVERAMVDTPLGAELALAADQFIVRPMGRRTAQPLAASPVSPLRSVIAGYHWFTDWGRDTMISLEGLTLLTGRHDEAASILRMFAGSVREGLIPNLFPEGEQQGLYHTADASLWFFHAVHRYVMATGDRALLIDLRPALLEIAESHLVGTRFGIGVDPTDGLLRQGADGYQLTWMDAKVGDWVVTPRRGKAVEINALWYNALQLFAAWETSAGRDAEAARWRAHAARTRDAFNRRFWNADLGCLFDVVDVGAGNDAACRPNQVFAIALDHPVLDRQHWAAVMTVVARELLTPFGLRTLSPRHPDYRRTYDGDLHARDAAYHQGTVWPWLIGPFIDAWRRAFPDDASTPSRALAALPDALGRTGIGSLPEIFDAEDPYHPRGCIAQAWSVAEVLRAWHVVHGTPSSDGTPRPVARGTA